MAGVLERRQGAVVGPPGARVPCHGWVALEGIVRPHLVVLAPECVEEPLLPSEIRAGRARGPGLVRPVHALMRAVLLRRCRADPLVLDPQPEPPDGELREPVAGRCSRRARHCRCGSPGGGRTPGTRGRTRAAPPPSAPATARPGRRGQHRACAPGFNDAESDQENIKNEIQGSARRMGSRYPLVRSVSFPHTWRRS